MKFQKGRLKFVVPLTAVVVVSSIIMLSNRYPDVPSQHKLFIILGAGIFTAIITYFLFPQRTEKLDDRGPY